DPVIADAKPAHVAGSAFAIYRDLVDPRQNPSPQPTSNESPVLFGVLGHGHSHNQIRSWVEQTVDQRLRRPQSELTRNDDVGAMASELPECVVWDVNEELFGKTRRVPPASAERPGMLHGDIERIPHGRPQAIALHARGDEDAQLVNALCERLERR